MKHGRRFQLLALAAAAAALPAVACQKERVDIGRVLDTPAPPDRGTWDQPRPLGGPRAPQQSAEELNTPLATIDDVTITVGEFETRIDRMSPYIRARYTSLEQKKEFLDSLVRFEILAKEAKRRGLDRDPEVVRTMKQVMIQKLINTEFDRRVTPDSVTDAEMKAYYDANPDEYVKPEEVRASAIIVKSKAQAARVAAEAATDAGKTNKGFRDLVEKYSQDNDSKLRSGDLRYLSRASTELPRPVVDAAFDLVKVGDVSGVVDAGNGTYYVLKQTGRRKAMIKTFEDAKAQIRNKLYREKRVDAQKSFIEELRGKAAVELFDDNLAKVHLDLSGAAGDAHGEGLPTMPADPDNLPPSPPPPAPTP